MGSKRLLLLASWLALLGGLLLLSQTVVLAASSPVRSAAAQTTDGLEMQLTVTPEAAKPGDRLTVQLMIVNHQGETVTPQVSLYLPEGVSPDMQTLPAGTSYNIRNGFLGWQPLIPGFGGMAELALDMTVDVAQIDRPEQTFRALMELGERAIEHQHAVWIGLPVRAGIALDRAQASVGQPFQLQAITGGPGPLNQQWQLGDGRVVDAQDPFVVYPEVGTYQITLNVNNPVSSVSASTLVQILPQPAAAFEVSDETVALNTPVSFLNLSGGQVPLTYRWDFGDGNASDLPQPAHIYAAPGTYDVRLLVENDFGTSAHSARVTVGAPPLAEMVLPPLVGAGSLFQGEARTDASVTSIRWTLGDGRSQEGHFLRHVYWSAGSFLVTMTAANPFGETSISQWIEVGPGNFYLYLPLLYRSSALRPGGLFGEAPVSAEELALVELDASELEPLELPAGTTPAESLLAYVNEARRVNGLPGLSLVQELNVAAQAHTDDMALNAFTSHTGSNGSTPPYRLNAAGYKGGYGGEATAWGMQSALDVVRFWLESPPHRAIILNPAATEVGVGFTQNFEAPSVWYWTAEFASMNLPVVAVTPIAKPAPVEQVLQLLGPPRDSAFVLQGSSNLVFTWSWPTPLTESQRFAVYLRSGARTYQIGVVRRAEADGQYEYAVVAGNVPAAPGDQFWLVRLEESGTGKVLAESPVWPIRFAAQAPVESSTAGAETTAEPPTEATPLPVATP